MLYVFEMGDTQKNSRVELPEVADDVVITVDGTVFIAYGQKGELAVVDLQAGETKEPFGENRDNPHI